MTIDMMRIIEDLAYPRLSGTDADEVKCKAYLVREFEGVGLEPIIDPVKFSKFPTNVLLRLIVLVIALGLGAAFVLEWLDLHEFKLVLIVVLVAVLAGAVLMQTKKTESFSMIGKQEDTFNILARVEAPSPGMNPRGIKDVLLVAHHDTKSQVVSPWVRGASYLGGILTSLALALVFITSSIVAFILGPQPVFKWVSLVLLLAGAPFMLVLLVNKAMEGKSTGALDNNTAIAILLKLAEHFRENPLKTMSLTFLITGAEEWGMHGAVAFWKEHATTKKTYEPATTVVFNYDTVAGGLSCIGDFGLGRKPYNKWLNEAFAVAARRLGIDVSPFWLPVPLATTDGWIFHKEGCETIDVVNKNMAKYIHSKKDTPAVCDEKTLKDAVAATIETVTALEA